MDRANEYLVNRFLDEYWNKERTVTAENPESAYSPPNPYLDLNMILSYEEHRKIANDQTTNWKGQKFRVVGSIGYVSYEAIFKTDFDGNTRVFVRGHEVKLELISEPERLSFAEPEEYPKLGFTFMHYAHMSTTIRDLRNAVVQHQVSGKPIKFPETRKKKVS